MTRQTTPATIIGGKIPACNDYNDNNKHGDGDGGGVGGGGDGACCPQQGVCLQEQRQFELMRTIALDRRGGVDAVVAGDIPFPGVVAVYVALPDAAAVAKD